MTGAVTATGVIISGVSAGGLELGINRRGFGLGGVFSLILLVLIGVAEDTRGVGSGTTTAGG
jgi:hypothetical protein